MKKVLLILCAMTTMNVFGTNEPTVSSIDNFGEIKYYEEKTKEIEGEQRHSLQEDTASVKNALKAKYGPLNPFMVIKDMKTENFYAQIPLYHKETEGSLAWFKITNPTIIQLPELDNHQYSYALKQYAHYSAKEYNEEQIKKLINAINNY